MKFFSLRWLVLASLIGFGAVGVASSNVGCGDSGGTGQAGAGGGAGGSGGAVAPRYIDAFENDNENWTLSTYVDANYVNLGAASDPDSGVSLDGGAAPTLTWSGSCGDPSPGCLRLTVTFSAFKQYVDPQVNLATPVDFMSGGHNFVRARIRLASGTFPAGGVQFHISSGLTAPNNYVYASAPFINAGSLVVGTWTMITLDANTLSATDGRVFDPSQIVQIGIQFTTGDPYAGDPPAFGDAVFEIDTISG
jgi:hypothetical protein